MQGPIPLRRILVCTTFTLTCALGLWAQDAPTVKNFGTPSAADYSAARDAKNIRLHAKPANTPAGQMVRVSAISNNHKSATGEVTSRVGGPADNGRPRFPGDLTFHGGQVVVSMQQHAIYMDPNGNCTIAGCWGNPEGFLRDLGKSDFIHVVDQYTGSSADNRYTVSNTRNIINYTPSAQPFTDADILAIVHQVASASGKTGYTNQYHVFLPPGQDECFDSTFSICYSPDNFNTWYFCAYHGSADFNDIGHVIYSVEPYQNVSGCSSRPNGPNGQLIDSTNNVLSHEVIETITDPDGTAWWNSLDNGLFGQEIADECSFITSIFTPPVYFDPSNVNLNGKRYLAQPEYDNSQHACTTRP